MHNEREAKKHVLLVTHCMFRFEFCLGQYAHKFHNVSVREAML
jgi:hypothetical protein